MPKLDRYPDMPGIVLKRDLEAFLRISPATRVRLQLTGNLPPFDIFVGPIDAWRAETMPDIAEWIAKGRTPSQQQSAVNVERHLSQATEMYL